MTAFNEYGPLRHVVVRSPVEAFQTQSRIEQQWEALNFTAPPDLGRACEQHRVFRELMAGAGAQLGEPGDADGLTLDAIYVRDASVLTPRGAVLCRMGKPARGHEPHALGRYLESIGAPVLGAIAPPGQLEGGDVVWFDRKTVAVGRGYRTNDAGIAQFRAFVGDDVNVIVVPLPHHRGPTDVFHLMSIVSPVDHDLAVVYSPLMPVQFRQWLLERRLQLIEVPFEEFDSMGGNVLAIAPRRCMMLSGNPVVAARLERAGAEVWTYDGSEISLKGGGGPTCLTRPLVRD